MFLAACFLPDARAAEPSLAWRVNDSAPHRPRLEAVNLPAATLSAVAGWDALKWQQAFAVFVETGDVLTDVDVPPLLGSCSVEGAVVRFTPQFDLEPGIRLRGVLRLSKLPGFGPDARTHTAPHRVPDMLLMPSTLVQAVYPSADVLPENLLKFYIHFTAPMSRGRVYEHIRLLRENGQPVELPFLELDEELWSPDMKRLTLFIDPGRIKREVKPLEEIGPSLEAGKRFVLEVDQSVKDARGLPLKASFRKHFSVGTPDREAIDPRLWQIHSPVSGGRQPLTVHFGKPMDHALAQRAITVLAPDGNVVEGTVMLTDRERVWQFTPEVAWAGGGYRIRILTTIEDLSGNNIGKPFEVDVFNAVARRVTHSTVELKFLIR